MSNTKYILHIRYWTPVRYTCMLAAARQKRCNDSSSYRSLTESPGTIFLLAGERNRRQSHDAVALEERQGSGDYVQHPRVDLSRPQVQPGRRVENGSRKNG